MTRRLHTRFFLANPSLAPELPETKLHLVCGAGGSRAIIGSAGAIFGLHAHGYNKWASVGGISGGAITSLLYAAGISPRTLLRRALTTDFSRLVVRSRHTLEVLRRFLGQAAHERLPRTAIHSSAEMIKFIDKLVPVWPDNYWTMAVADVEGRGRCQVLFTKEGVFLYDKFGARQKLSQRAAPVGLAVAASCAIPGVIEHVEYLGLALYDGMLSWDGRNPAGLVNRHFAADYSQIVAVDVGAIKPAFPAIYRQIAAYLCDDDCHPDTHMSAENLETLGVKVVRAQVSNFGSLNLNPKRKQRSNALRLGYRAAVRSVCVKGKKVKLKEGLPDLLESPYEKLALPGPAKKSGFFAVGKKGSKQLAGKRKTRTKTNPRPK